MIENKINISYYLFHVPKEDEKIKEFPLIFQ